MQTVFITQPLTLRGGYTLTNWTVSDPLANPTTINPQGLGRGILIINANQVLVENLRLVNGIASGFYSGGGIGVAFSEATVNECWIEENM
jgi:hypothetical protein